MLKKIDECKSRGYKPDQLEHEISEACKANLGGDLAKTSNPSDEMLEMDEMSHHILRLVFCQTEDKRKWFVNQELALFKYVPSWKGFRILSLNRYVFFSF